MLKLCLGYVCVFICIISFILLLIFNFIEFLVHFLADSVVDPKVGEVHGTVVELEAPASIEDDRAGVGRAGGDLKGMVLVEEQQR